MTLQGVITGAMSVKLVARVSQFLHGQGGHQHHSLQSLDLAPSDYH
jgi:hypothetical protein